MIYFFVFHLITPPTEPLLNTMEKDVLNLLSEELQLCAKSLINDLKKVMECLKLEPTDLNEFANYASMVFIC